MARTITDDTTTKYAEVIHIPKKKKKVPSQYSAATAIEFDNAPEVVRTEEPRPDQPQADSVYQQ